MSSFTNFLNLFKWNPTEDSEEEFNIDKALNENWDKIDNKLQTHMTDVINDISTLQNGQTTQGNEIATINDQQSIQNQYITNLQNYKVDKIEGKGLSENDYDDTEKQKVADNTSARHTHSNKSILDLITEAFTTILKAKLDGIAENANNYSLPIADASTLGGIKAGGTGINIDANGVISSTGGITIDSALSSTSTNPVQNKVVKTALDSKQPTLTGGATTIATSNLTASRTLVSDASGKVAVSSITSAELANLKPIDISSQFNSSFTKSLLKVFYYPINKKVECVFTITNINAGTAWVVIASTTNNTYKPNADIYSKGYGSANTTVGISATINGAVSFFRSSEDMASGILTWFVA